MATEDVLHSVAANVIGLGFTVGVMAVGITRARRRGRADPFDWVAFLAGPLIPLAMLSFASLEGVLQRMMFAIAYVWYLREASRIPPPPGRPA